MNIKTQPQALLGWMTSLADPVRLRLLRLLERQELGVAELCAVVQMPQSSVSRHLKVLGDEGWTHNRREGTANLYRMNQDELSPAARQLWSWARGQTAAWPALEQDRLRLERVLAHRQRDAQEFFANAAQEWDKLRDWLYGKAFNQAALLALFSPDWVVADLGCGTGVLSAALAPYVRRIIGVDQSTAMLKAARQRLAAVLPDQTNVDLRRGRLEKLPLATAGCDAALLVLVLTYIAEPEQVLQEAARILKPGGRLVIVDLLQHDREDFRRQMGQQCLGFDPRQLEELLRQTGLHTPHSRALAPEPEAKGPALLLATATK